MIRDSEIDYRDLAIGLIEDGSISSKDLIIALVKYMSHNDVFDCLKVNDYLPVDDARNYWNYTHPELLKLINNNPS